MNRLCCCFLGIAAKTERLQSMADFHVLREGGIDLNKDRFHRFIGEGLHRAFDDLMLEPVDIDLYVVRNRVSNVVETQPCSCFGGDG
jgi:hypothetical protein